MNPPVWKRWAVATAAAAAVAVVVAGCTTDEFRDAARDAAPTAAAETAFAPADFQVEIDLFRRYTGARWRPVTDGRFEIRDESHLKAEVVLRNVRPRRIYSVHLVWIRPDGREMFRRYAEIARHEVRLPEQVAPDSTGALPADVLASWRDQFDEKTAKKLAARLAADPQAVAAVHEVVYKKAIDLRHEQRSYDIATKPVVTLDSRLNLSREKERQPGRYYLRVYLDRRLLNEVPFDVEG
jgi:hypothetical protein